MEISLNTEGQQAHQTFSPLSQETRPAVPTEAAAYYLHRKPQTLRKWAVYDGTGPVRAIRCNGRLLWPLDQIRTAPGVTPEKSVPMTTLSGYPRVCRVAVQTYYVVITG